MIEKLYENIQKYKKADLDRQRAQVHVAQINSAPIASEHICERARNTNVFGNIDWNTY